jgi:hypothetical protein
MNLHGIAVGAIQAVNPQIPATIKKSTGYTTTSDGTQVPTYDIITGMVQMQGLVEREYAVLEQEAGFSMNAVNRKIFAYGSLNMVIRTLGQGGDVIQTGSGDSLRTWKIVRMWEAWPDWCAVIVRQQLDTP